MNNGLFIAFEGIDGSGKSTQAKHLAHKMEAHGHLVHLTFEPTDGRIGQLIRKILKGEVKADERVIAALFTADRLDHLLNETNGIVKKLKEGYHVITDRYYFSSYAYNGNHLSMDWVIHANSLSAEILRPDLTVFIDVAPETCMERIMANREGIEHYETLDNLISVRSKYYEAFDLLQSEEKIWKVNGDGETEVITNEIWRKIDSLLEKNNTD